MYWQAIIFDRDGTLFDSLPVIIRSFNYAIEPYTWRCPKDAEWFAVFGPPEIEVLGNFVSADRKEEAYARFLQYYKDHDDESPLFAGLPELLTDIRERGTRLVLFTGAGLETARWSLQRRGILHLFDLLVTGDDVARPKPDPEGLIKAIHALKLEPERTLVVGDAESDVRAGKQAGVKTVLVRWAGLPQAQDLCRADFVFHTVPEFRDFVFNYDSRTKRRSQ